MARFIARRLLLSLDHAVAARHDRVHHRQRPAQRRRDGRSWARSRRRRASTRSTSSSGRTGRSSSSTSTRSSASSRSTSATRTSTASRSCRSSSAAIGPLGEAGRPRAAAHDPDRRSSPALYAARRRDRAADRAIVLLGVTSSSIPEFVTGDDPGGRRRRPAASCCPSSRRRRRTPTSRPRSVPADARDGDGHRVLRLHRADDPGRHDRGPPVRLHPDRDHEGPDHAAR